MKIAIILGTRPEIIKMSPIIRACQKMDIEFTLIHTGQHYSPNMDFIFFEELELPKPDHNLHVGSKPYRKQVGTMIHDLRAVLRKEKPSVVIVQGDTLTVLTGALAAEKEGVPLAHHEAGLRSHDLSMPEETNRIITDHISEVLFSPTADAHANLIEEGIPPEIIFQSGNTIVDAVLQNKRLARSEILDALGLKPKEFILVTAHRAENVDNMQRLKQIAEALKRIAEEHDLTIVFPLHPRTKKRLEEFGIALDTRIKKTEPFGYLEFLTLEEHARLIITDSGGLQEEASILRVPCVTIRDNTERPETVAAGMNIIAGVEPESVIAAVREMLTKDIAWSMPFGDGTAAIKIVKKLKELYG
jgi:UDP-N-acetylglucosamine 2-epimerase (non-hydrolysing)